jgi:hypothetical protein
MFTPQEYQHLRATARFLSESRILTTASPPSLVCFLALLGSDHHIFDVPYVAKQLDWSEKRARRCLNELVTIQVKAGPLIEVMPKAEDTPGRFTPTRYRLGFLPAQTEPASAVRDPFPAPAPEKGGIDGQAPSPKTTTDENGQPKHKIPLPNPSAGQNGHPSSPNALTSTPCCCVNQTTTEGGLKRGDARSCPLHSASQDGQPLIEKLTAVGVNAETARLLVTIHPPPQIERQLAMLPYRNAQNPAALLVKAIREDWSAPYIAAKNRSPKPLNPFEVIRPKLEEQTRRQKQRDERLKQLAARLSVPERAALHNEASHCVRQRIGKAWPPDKPIPSTFLTAEFNRLLEQRFADKPAEAKPQATKRDPKTASEPDSARKPKPALAPESEIHTGDGTGERNPSLRPMPENSDETSKPTATDEIG